MVLSKKTKKIALIVLIVIASMAILAGVSTGIYFGVATVATKGVVLEQGTDTPIANVSVTDGRNVIQTNENGEFKLKGWHKARYLTVTNPTGYWTENYYQEISRSKKDYKFYLKKTEVKENHSFMQITDTEIGTEPGAWFDESENGNDLKGLVEQEKPDFIIHTGDICYENGLRNHIKYLSTQTMGVPVRYTIGNHDFVNLGRYSEETFEDNYGPVNYSFDMGNVHYMVTSLAYGDYPAKYTYSDVVTWVQNDLKYVDDNKSVVIFNHDVCRDETGMVMKSGTKKIELKKENVIAWINGHLHYNFINNYDGILNVSSAPLVGGIDGSIGGVRMFNIEGKTIKDTYMRYTDYVSKDSEAGYAWQTEFKDVNDKIKGRFLYTEPQIVGDRVYVGMMQNDYPRQPVFACLDATTGEVLGEFEVATSIKNDFYIDADKGIAVIQDSSGIVYGLNLDDIVEGKIQKLWKEVDMNLITYRYSMTGIVGDGDYVYCGNSRFVYCFKVATGEQVWKANFGKGEPSPYKMQIIGDQLIIGDHWRAHYSLDKNTGKKNWMIDKWINAVSSVFEYNGSIYTLKTDTLIKIDSSNGKILQEVKIKSELGGKEHSYNFDIGSQPVVDGNIAYIGTNDKGVIALNLDSLQVIWECNTGTNMIYATPYSGKGSAGVQGRVVISGDKLYFGAMDGNIYVANKNDGNVIDTFYIGAPILSKVILEQDFVIVSDFEGRVTRVNLKATGEFERINV